MLFSWANWVYRLSYLQTAHLLGSGCLESVLIEALRQGECLHRKQAADLQREKGKSCHSHGVLEKGPGHLLRHWVFVASSAERLLTPMQTPAPLKEDPDTEPHHWSSLGWSFLSLEEGPHRITLPPSTYVSRIDRCVFSIALGLFLQT